MARVRWTRHLERYFPALADHSSALEVNASTAAEVVQQLEALFPGIGGYIVDEHGALRTHVNIFIDGAPVRDRERLEDGVGAAAEVVIMQALSGG